jgi:hypothetical protein
MKRLLLLFSILICTTSGCFWPFTSQKRVESVPAVSDGVSVEVLDAALLKKGGKLYFMPFSAGADAEAGDTLDRVALMMVKGVSDALSEGGSGFVLVDGQDAANADVVIRGHIEQFKLQGTFKKTVLIKVRGDVRAVRENENIIALVYAERQAEDPGAGADKVAYDFGYAIARRISE